MSRAVVSSLFPPSTRPLGNAAGGFFFGSQVGAMRSIYRLSGSCGCLFLDMDDLATALVFTHVAAAPSCV